MPSTTSSPKAACPVPTTSAGSPELARFTRVGGSEDRLAVSDVVLAVEVISPGSWNIDLHLKPFEYVEAGIPHYWLVDLDPSAPSITVFHQGAPDDGYVEGPATAGQLVTTVPFDLCIDIPALVAPRP
ncbi:MAG: Uma2 family endonuclease [Pseudonocardiaceae bacterium]